MTVIRATRPLAMAATKLPPRSATPLPFFSLTTLRLALRMLRDLVLETGTILPVRIRNTSPNLVATKIPQGPYRGLYLIAPDAQAIPRTDLRRTFHPAFRVVRVASFTLAILLLFAAF